ncbi:MAG: epimerase [Sphingobacteriales bacterium]|nr:epimerase [Sphingobacteriales bacterium]
MTLRVIITGTTGMVGEGVLHECLNHTSVEQVLVINRKPGGVSHPKLKEIIHTDFFNFSPIEDQLSGYNTAFFCLGVSSVGMNETKYAHLTYDLTIHVAETILKKNPDMSITYVSGVGTDSTEKGSSMWARVKGKTENALLKMPFKKAYMFRPGYIHPLKGLKNTNKYYGYISWLYPIISKVFPKYVSTMQEVSRAMINAVVTNYEKSIIEVEDINKLAQVNV